MVIFAQLQRLFSPRPDKAQAQYLYNALMEQARQPGFYTEFQVPDTLDGRFEMVVLHLFLVLERLKADFSTIPETHDISRGLIEIYIADMDRTLREMGVGDTGIKRRIKQMTSAFYGRMDAYAAASDDAAWQETLERNVYGTLEKITKKAVKNMAVYVLASQKTLAKQETSEILAAKPRFAPLTKKT